MNQKQRKHSRNPDKLQLVPDPEFEHKLKSQHFVQLYLCDILVTISCHKRAAEYVNSCTSIDSFAFLFRLLVALLPFFPVAQC